MNKMTMYKTFVLLLCTSLLQSCKVGPKYTTPQTDLPNALPPSYLSSAVSVEKEWWRSFSDHALNELLEETLSTNSDVLIAMSNVSQAQAQLSLGQSAILPTIELQASANKSKESKNSGSHQTAGQLTKASSIGALLTYEIDLWGKVSSANEAGRATILSSSANLEAVKQAVVSTVVSSYFSLLALDDKISTTKNLIASQKEILNITKSMVKNGAASTIDLNNAITDLSNLEAALPGLEQQRQEQETALGILLGRSPKALIDNRIKRGKPFDKVACPTAIPKMMPSELLNKRPDIRAAEENLKTANALIGVAKAAYFPSLSLSALVGMSSSDINQLFNRHSRTYELTKAASVPIFDFGATRANVKLSKIQKDQAMIAYALTVRTAFAEAANALSGVNTSVAAYVATQSASGAAASSLHLIEQKHRLGAASRVDVLVAKNSLLQIKLQSIDAMLVAIQARAMLFKALGS